MRQTEKHTHSAWILQRSLMLAVLCGLVGGHVSPARAQSPDSLQLYITNPLSGRVSVIHPRQTDLVLATLPTGTVPGDLALSPDGRRLYVLAGDLLVVDTTSRTVVGIARVGPGAASVAVSRDGRLVFVTHPTTNTVSIVDATTNDVVARVPVEGSPAEVVVSPNGQSVFAASASSNRVSVIDPFARRVVGTIQAGEAPRSLLASPGGRWLFVANTDGNVLVLDPRVRGRRFTIRVGGVPSLLAVSPDSQRLYVAKADSDVISVIDTGMPVGERPQPGFGVVPRVVGSLPPLGFTPQVMTISPDGQKLFVANASGDTLAVIDTTSRQVATIRRPATGILDILPAPDGRVFLSSSGRVSEQPENLAFPSVELVDVTQPVLDVAHQFLGEVTVGSTPYSVAMSPDGTRAYVANSGGDSVSVINTTDRSVVATVPVVGPYGVTVSPDGTRVYVTQPSSSQLSVIDTSTQQVTTTIPLAAGGEPFEAAVRPDGQRVYVTHSARNEVAVIDTANNQVVATIPVGIKPRGVAIRPDGQRVYVANFDSDTVSVIDTTSNQVVATITVGTGPFGVAVSRDGTELYVSNMKGTTVSAINTANEQVIATIELAEGPAMLAFSPDGQSLYVTQPGLVPQPGAVPSNPGNRVWVIDRVSKTVASTITLAPIPFGIAVKP